MPQLYGTEWGAAGGRRIAQLLVRGGWRLRVHGAERMPAAGPVIIASNHIGAVDGAILIAASPRPVFMVAKSGIFVPVVDNIFRWGGLIPIEYDRADRKALLECVDVLERGDVLGIFPEGHRGRGRVEQVRSGTSYLALRSGAVVQPLTLFGTRRTGQGKNAMPRIGTRIDAVFGEPFTPEPRDWRRRSGLLAANEELRSRLAAEVQRAMASTGLPLPDDSFDDEVTP